MKETSVFPRMFSQQKTGNRKLLQAAKDILELYKKGEATL
jgi:hypothetical protein